MEFNHCTLILSTQKTHSQKHTLSQQALLKSIANFGDTKAKGNIFGEPFAFFLNIRSIYIRLLEFEIKCIPERTHSAQVLTARSICSEEWATSMNWKSIRQPAIDIYRWSSGAQEGGGVMGVTLHPGPFSIHQERCMERLKVSTRSESWQERVRETEWVELRPPRNKAGGWMSGRLLTKF